MQATSKLEFKVTGRIQEKESGLGVAGLLVRAYDKDLLFDDLLGTAVTDERGEFELHYGEKDFRELFEKRPDIYLAVYAPPCRLLLETKQQIRWSAGRAEHFELELAREALGGHAPTLPDDQVEGGLALDENAVRIERRGDFELPRIFGMSNEGAPGAPAVPQQIQYAALPLGGDILALEVIPGDPVGLPSAGRPFPAQEPTPDVGVDPRQFGDDFDRPRHHEVLEVLEAMKQ